MDIHIEEKLVKSCCNGQKQAYAILVKNYSRYVFAICFGIVSNVQDAEDLSQQTLLKGFTDIESIKDGNQFKSWIGQIARNLCIDFLRKQNCNQKCLAELVLDHDGGFNEYPELQRSLAKLTEEYRLPLSLYYLDGQSTKKIAEILQISQNGVQARISRGRKQLRKLLVEEKI